MEISNDVLDRFLLQFIPISAEQFVIKIDKSDLKARLSNFLVREGVKEDLVIVFEDLEMRLSKTRTIIGHLVRYDYITDKLRIEYIPTASHIERALEFYNANIVPTLMKCITNLSPYAFEEFVVEILSKVDWAKHVTVTQKSKDGGIDFIGDYILPDSTDTMTMLGEAKHWNKPVGVKQIREFIGVLASNERRGPRIGIYISTSGFTEAARKATKKTTHMIHCYDAKHLVDLMLKYEIGIQKINGPGEVIDEQFWKDLEE